ncbi:MAG: hypothetical protein KGJ13_04485 [Patescibacteria group bacterium]|nr:hypothetical protein [Patescibacteria group bacterium]
MSTTATVILIIVVAIALIAVWLIAQTSPGQQVATPAATGTPGTSSYANTAASSTSDQSISDGVISISFPSADFGLATTSSQILARTYIPPCSENFDYCLYYIGNAFQGTNFESAGIRIDKRTDLKTQTACLTTPPEGYTTAPSSTTTSADTYAASAFAVGGAATGHYANGTLYRLFYQPSGACYEFETRIGQSQFANYPSGTIRMFTSNDQGALQSEIQRILQTLRLPNGGSISLP